MSISNRMFQKIEGRKNPQEIFYYIQRCLYNAELPGTTIDVAENFLDQAWRLGELLERLNDSTWGQLSMTECENCHWIIGEGTKHESDDDGLCIVRQIDTEKPLGWKRRRGPVKKMYKS